MRRGLGTRWRLPRRRLVWVLAGSAAIVVIASVGVLALAHDDGKSAAARATTRVRRGTVTVTVSASGTVQALQSRALNFSTSGTVTELNVKTGDVVTAGAVLARIDDTDARSSVDQAQTSVENAEDAVSRATRSSTGTSSTSTCVAAAGYQVTVPSASPSASAGPSGTPGNPGPSASTGPVATRVPATSASGGQPTGGQPTGAQPTGGAGAPCATGGGSGGSGGGGAGAQGGGDSLLSAQQQLNNAKLALVQAQQKLAGTVITAPIGGKILSVGGALGSDTSPSSSGFIVLAGVNDAAVQAQFTEAEVADLAAGQPAKIVLSSRADEELAGKVLQISPAGVASNRLVRYAALVTFDEVPQDLLLGQSATVAVVTASATDVLYVPSGAVTGRDTAKTVMVVHPGKSDEQRTVDVGLRGDVYTEIRSGLVDGDEVRSAGR